MLESLDPNTVDSPTEPSGVRVQLLTFKRDAETIARTTETYRQLREVGEQRRLDQIYAGRRQQRARYDRALKPVVPLYPEPTGNPIEDAQNRRHAELEAQDQRQINAGRVWRYEHGHPI